MGRDLVGIFAVDPGTTTGYDYGLWRTNCGVKEAVSAYRGICDEITGSYDYQARMLAQMFAEFSAANSGDRRVTATHLVIEKYVQRPTAHFVSDESLDPVKVAYMTLGYLTALTGRAVPVVWQMPAESMTYANNVRLREWGAWVRGKEHGRDARRHSLKLRAQLSGSAR